MKGAYTNIAPARSTSGTKNRFIITLYQSPICNRQSAIANLHSAISFGNLQSPIANG